RRPAGDRAIHRLRKIGTRNWPQISRCPCGPPLRLDSLAASFRRVALAQNPTRQSTHRARAQIDCATPCNPSTGLISTLGVHEFLTESHLLFSWFPVFLIHLFPN